MQKWKIFQNNIISCALQKCPVFHGFVDQHEFIIVINSVVKIYLQVKNENKRYLKTKTQKNICTKISEYLNNIRLRKLQRIKYEYHYSDENIWILKKGIFTVSREGVRGNFKN